MNFWHKAIWLLLKMPSMKKSLRRLKRNFNTLKVLRKAPVQQQKYILAHETKDLIECIGEIIGNLLEGKVKLTSMQKRKLQMYKHMLRKIHSKRKTAVTRKLVVQKGGFLSALLGPALGVIGSLLRKL